MSNKASTRKDIFLELRKADIVKKNSKENKDTKQTQLECLFSAIAVS